MSVDQNGWQDVPEEEREALTQWEETQGGDHAGMAIDPAVAPRTRR